MISVKKCDKEDVDNDVLKNLITANPRLSSVELSAILGFHQITNCDNLKAIGKVSKAGIWVPHQLSSENLLHRATICTSLFPRQQSEPFLKRIVTADKKWVSYVNVECKRQWLAKAKPPYRRQNLASTLKKFSFVFGVIEKGVIYFELLDQNQTITADMYCQQLDRVKTSLATKRPVLINRCEVIL